MQNQFHLCLVFYLFFCLSFVQSSSIFHLAQSSKVQGAIEMEQHTRQFPGEIESVEPILDYYPGYFDGSESSRKQWRHPFNPNVAFLKIKPTGMAPKFFLLNLKENKFSSGLSDMRVEQIVPLKSGGFLIYFFDLKTQKYSLYLQNRDLTAGMTLLIPQGVSMEEGQLYELTAPISSDHKIKLFPLAQGGCAFVWVFENIMNQKKTFEIRVLNSDGSYLLKSGTTEPWKFSLAYEPGDVFPEIIPFEDGSFKVFTEENGWLGEGIKTIREYDIAGRTVGDIEESSESIESFRKPFDIPYADFQDIEVRFEGKEITVGIPLRPQGEASSSSGQISPIDISI